MSLPGVQSILNLVDLVHLGQMCDLDCLNSIRDFVGGAALFDRNVAFSKCSRYQASLLADLYPHKGQFLMAPYNIEDAPSPSPFLSRTDALAVICTEVLHGISIFDSDDSRRATAARLADLIVSPIRKPTAPFNDEDPFFEPKP